MPPQFIRTVAHLQGGFAVYSVLSLSLSCCFFIFFFLLVISFVVRTHTHTHAHMHILYWYWIANTYACDTQTTLSSCVHFQSEAVVIVCCVWPIHLYERYTPWVSLLLSLSSFPKELSRVLWIPHPATHILFLYFSFSLARSILKCSISFTLNVCARARVCTLIVLFSHETEPIRSSQLLCTEHMWCVLGGVPFVFVLYSCHFRMVLTFAEIK